MHHFAVKIRRQVVEAVKQARHSALGSDIMYVFLAQIVIMIAVFGVNKVVSLATGVTGFAVFSLIKRGGGILGSVMGGGLSTALPRYLARYSAGRTSLLPGYLLRVSILLVTLFAALCGICLCFFPGFFSDLLFQEKTSALLLALTFLFAIAQSYNGLLYSYYQGMGDFKQYNLLQIICSSGGLIFTLAGYRKVETIIGYSYGFLLIFSVGMLLYILGKWHLEPLRGIYKRKIAVILSVYGTPRMLHQLISFLQDVVPLTIILHRFGLHAVGIYTSGITLPLVITPLFAFAGGVYLQRVTLYYKQRRYDIIRRIMRLSLILFLVIACVGAVIIMLIPEFLVSLLYSEEFKQVVTLIPYFALTILGSSVYLLFRNPLDALSSRPYNLYIVSARVVLLIVLLVLADDIKGCAEAYFYSSLLLIILPLTFYRHLMRKLTA